MFSLKFSLRVNIQAGCGKTPGHWRVRRTDADPGVLGPERLGAGGEVTSLTSLTPLDCPQTSCAQILPMLREGGQGGIHSPHGWMRKLKPPRLGEACPVASLGLT